MPRLSVDIDLTYLPLEDRDISLRRIQDSLVTSAEELSRIRGIKVIPLKNKTTGYVNKLLVRNSEAQIKVEPNEVLRGSVYPCEERELTRTAQDEFEMSVSAKCLSIADLYGGKICAALDRQHPRDFFDIKLLLDDTGITKEIKTAFIIYLVAGDRPIAELLDPQFKEIETLYKEQFLGMTIKKISLQDLYDTRDQLLRVLRSSLTEADKEFILSVKEGRPNWSLLHVKGLDQLPSIAWKLTNIKRMSPEKHQAAIKRLQAILNSKY